MVMVRVKYRVRVRVRVKLTPMVWITSRPRVIPRVRSNGVPMTIVTPCVILMAWVRIGVRVRFGVRAKLKFGLKVFDEGYG